MKRSTVHESYRLGSKETDWSLPGGTASNNPVRSRTRNAGNGRPNLAKRVFNEILTSSSDSEYEEEEVSSSDEGINSEEEDEEEEEEEEGGEAQKPSCTRLILEYESLKKCMEKNCRCPECNGPVEMQVNTLCLASNVMLCCKDEDCGYIDHSDLPSSAKVGETSDERGRSTDYAINVLYVLGFVSYGDGPTEAGRLLGLLGLPNHTTMASRSFGIIEDRISPIIQSVTSQILLENLMEEVRLTYKAMPF
jgi:hypothetical protein